MGDRRVYVLVDEEPGRAHARFAELERAHKAGARAGFGEYVLVTPGGEAPPWLPRAWRDLDEAARAIVASAPIAVVRKLAAIVGAARGGRRFATAELPGLVARLNGRMAAFPAVGSGPEPRESRVERGGRLRVIAGDATARRAWAAETVVQTPDETVWIDGAPVEDAIVRALGAPEGVAAGAPAIEVLRVIDFEIDPVPILFVDGVGASTLEAIEATRRLRWVLLVEDGRALAARLGVKEERLAPDEPRGPPASFGQPGAEAVEIVESERREPVPEVRYAVALARSGLRGRAREVTARLPPEARAEIERLAPAPPLAPPPGRPEAPRGRVKVGRNAPCPCGSGRKYKRCHGG